MRSGEICDEILYDAVQTEKSKGVAAVEASATKFYRFDGFIVDVQSTCLRRDENPVPLRPKSFAVLLYLVQNPGRLVQKNELIDNVWSNVIVTDNSLVQCVKEVREALGDDLQRIIKTVAKRGYVFAATVIEIDAPKIRGAQRPVDDTAQDSAVPVPLRPAAVRPNEPERRQLTIMACEIVGLATLSARLDPEDLREVVAAYHGCIREVVEQQKGFVAKFLPEGALVCFGYPQANEDDAERAVRAGLAATMMIGDLRVPCLEVKLQARAGIATGLVVVGSMTDGGPPSEHMVIGDTPLLANRLVALADPGAVVMSTATRRLVGKLFECIDLGVAELQHAGEPAGASQVLRENPIGSRFEALRDSRMPLFGREEELDLLLRRWDQAKTGEGRVIHITGEPGIGKSRLAQALVDCLVSERHTRVQCHCSPYSTDSALHPVISHLLKAAGIEHTDAGEERLAKLEVLFRPSRSGLADTIPLLAPLLSIPLGQRYAPLDLSPQRRKERTLAALIDQLAELAIHQPVLMVFEDAHWIDPTSLELLSLTIDRVVRLPILLIITARPEFSPPWPTHRHISVLTLGRLGQREGMALVHRIAKGKVLPTEVLNAIIEHTDGVPLFIEELTKTVLEGGLLQEGDDRYVLTGPLPPLAIPSTLHASLLARLDRLAAVKDVAQIGAAIGREFSYSLISAVSGMPEQELAAALAKLVAAELIFQRGVPPDATYRFKHALVQDTAYASLLRSRRRALHAAIVNELVAGGVSGTEVEPEVLAHHCAEAGMANEAVRHYLEASQQSVVRSALAEAAVMLDKALGQVAQLAATPAQDRSELEVQCARGAVLLALKGFGAAETAKTFTRARDLWDRLGRPPEFLLRMARQGHLVRCEFLEALSLAEDLLEFGRAHGDTVGLISGYFARSRTHVYRGELLSARAKLEEMIGLYDVAVHAQLFQYGGTDPIAAGLAHLGQVLLFLGYPDQALMRAEAAIRQARQLAHAPTVAQCLALNARQASILGDEVRLAQRVQELRALTEEHRYRHWSAQVPIYEGQLQLTRGEARAAVTLMRRGLDAYRATGATLWSAYFAILLAEALTQDGRLEEALSLLEDQIAAVGATGELWCAAELHRRRGQLLRKGTVLDFSGAQAEFLQAIDIARGQSAKLWELRAAVSLARLWRDQGRNSDAHHLLSPIYAWFTEGFDCADLKAAKLLLDELSVSQSPV